MAKEKTNLTLDKNIKEQAIAYVRKRGKSLSDLIQELLERELDSSRAKRILDK
jgi:hypothetical protein